MKHKTKETKDRDIYVVDFDDTLVFSTNPELEKRTHYLTLNYVKVNENWHYLFEEEDIHYRKCDIVICTSRHPILKDEISKMFYGWEVICRDFNLNIKKIMKQKEPINLKKWNKKIVKSKVKTLRKLSKKYKNNRVIFVDDNWKLYIGKIKRKNVNLIEVNPKYE